MFTGKHIAVGVVLEKRTLGWVARKGQPRGGLAKANAKSWPRHESTLEEELPDPRPQLRGSRGVLSLR